MSLFGKKDASSGGSSSFTFEKKRRFRWWHIAVGIFVVILIVGGIVFLKAGATIGKISVGKDGFLKNIVKTLPGVEKKLSGEDEGRINILLLGMRGEHVTGGGLLADTIMVLSIHPKNDAIEGDTAKASLVSIPRDFYVKIPNKDWQAKINAVYAEGENRSHGGGGMEDMRTIVSEITGQNIPYSVAINFEGFKEIVDAVGGITVTLDQPFSENLQFRGLEQRCDGVRYTIPSGNYEEKRIRRKNGTYYLNPKRYPLCYAKVNPEDLECNGKVSLPAGDSQLNGEQALCFARARYGSSDFDRAKRQQQVIEAVKKKALSIGTLSDFEKINGLLNGLGNNVLTNLEGWEMKRLFDLYQKMGDVAPTSRVLDTTEEGLLYHPETTKETGYILLPAGDNYDKIREMFAKLP